MIKQVDGKWCLFTKDGRRKLGCHDTKGEAEEQERVIKERTAAGVVKRGDKWCHPTPGGGEMCHDSREKAERMARTMAASRSFKGAAHGAKLRTESFNGKQHLVVPVVALVEGVLFAVNAEGPELVLAEEFSKAPEGWNGRPTVGDHPSSDGVKISANDPRVLEREAFGSVFHARVEDKKLLVEAYLDPERAQRVGRDAERVIERIRAGETVEVSVGVFVMSEQRSGEKDGMPFVAVWKEIVPDHLAFLPEGKIGACDVEMGCGAPRAAEAVGKESHVKKTPKERFADATAKFRPSQEEGTSDSDLRMALDAAIRADEPGYLGIDSVFPAESVVVYAVAPEDTVVLFRREFNLGSDNAVTLSRHKEEVKAVLKFEPVKTAAAATSCACGKTLSTTEGKEESMERKNRIAALVGKQCFTAAHMESFSEEALKALEDHVASAKPADAATVAATPPAAPPAPAVAATPATPVTPPAAPVQAATPAVPAPVETSAKVKTPEEEEAEFLAKAPESVKTIVTEHKAAEAKRKTELVARIKAASKVYNDAELAAMSVGQLDKLAQVAAPTKGSVDFGPKGAPRAAEADENAAPPPIDLAKRFRDAAKEQKAN